MNDLNPVHTMYTSGAIKNRDGKIIAIWADYLLETNVGNFFCPDQVAAMEMIAKIDEQYNLSGRA